MFVVVGACGVRRWLGQKAVQMRMHFFALCRISLLSFEHEISETSDRIRVRCGGADCSAKYADAAFSKGNYIEGGHGALGARAWQLLAATDEAMEWGGCAGGNL
mmetsp:Transcript_60378/g.88427  ORF Transcript_60378/g.88427 Transcript_60378/m.88427 type:complete len:104 (-) Transcript_60378:2824-3135(-)